MIQPGDMIFFDLIHAFNGYRTCYYRTFICGVPNKYQIEAYEKCSGWVSAALDVVKPGVTTADIAAVWPTAQDVGYRNEEEAYGLQVGHGVGLSNHEKPIITRAASLAMPVPLEAGMHFALETFAGDGEDGARIESQVLVTEKGHEVITRWPCEELMVCAPR